MPPSSVACSNCGRQHPLSRVGYLGDNYEDTLCTTCGPLVSQGSKVKYIELSQPPSNICSNCGSYFSGSTPRPSLACPTHNFNLCGSCSTPARLASHQQARHFMQPLTWELFLIRASPAGGRASPSLRPSSGQYMPRDDGNGITEHRVGGRSFFYTTPTVTSSQSTFDSWIASNGGNV